MDDITVRLRRGFGGLVPPVCDEAANEIDRLRGILNERVNVFLPPTKEKATNGNGSASRDD